MKDLLKFPVKSLKHLSSSTFSSQVNVSLHKYTEIRNHNFRYSSTSLKNGGWMREYHNGWFVFFVMKNVH